MRKNNILATNKESDDPIVAISVKAALKCRRWAIATTVITALFLALQLIPKKAFDGAWIFPYIAWVGGIQAALVSVVFWIHYSRELTKIENRKLKGKERAEKFAQWLKNFDPFAKTAAMLVPADDGNERFSKFGGLPVVPDGFKWPTYDGEPIPFLMQLDFSEINADGSITNFPRSGMLCVFVDEFVGDDGWEMQSKILYFEGSARLTHARKPRDLETVYNEVFVERRLVKTYPDKNDCDEAFTIYRKAVDSGMDDRYDELIEENVERHLVGGWPSYVQDGGFVKRCRESERDAWVLLLQIKSDDEYTWDGVIHVCIREKDLFAKNFDNIKLERHEY